MKIQFYNVGVEEFIFSLEKQTIQRVLRSMDLLEKNGQNLTMPHSKYLGRRLFELRIRGK